MKILDWMSEFIRQLFDRMGSLFGLGGKKRRGGSGYGPPESGSGVPRRPRLPRRGASAAQPLPTPEPERCDLIGGRR